MGRPGVADVQELVGVPADCCAHHGDEPTTDGDGVDQVVVVAGVVPAERLDVLVGLEAQTLVLLQPVAAPAVAANVVLWVVVVVRSTWNFQSP